MKIYVNVWRRLISVKMAQFDFISLSFAKMAN